MIPERGFPQIEFEQRLEKAQQLMNDSNLDVLFFCSDRVLPGESGMRFCPS